MPSHRRRAFPDRSFRRRSAFSPVAGRNGVPGALLLAALAVPALLGGCKLVDQRTFDPAAGRPPVPRYPPAPPPKPAPAPLALVRFNNGDDWRPAVTAIVRAALERKPDAVFRVLTVVPGGGTPEQQATLLAGAARTQGAAVADTVRAAGAEARQIELAGTADPGIRDVEVRLTAR
ncbi:MAG: hypothetical protein INR65_06225 [Gluconacetobacter diazotrophicus]|nr:hypothetical protein [Gluconacetobacter diazotrophicus]